MMKYDLVANYYMGWLPYWQVVGAFHVLTLSEASRALSNLHFVGGFVLFE